MNASEIVEKYETYKKENVTPWLLKLRQLKLDNVSPDGAGLRMYAFEAHNANRYQATDDERKRGVSCVVTVPFTAEEREALDKYYSNVKISNAMYPEYKKAKEILGIKSGKLMESKYAGKSSLSGMSFGAGEMIYYSKFDGKTYTVPVAEIENIDA